MSVLSSCRSSLRNKSPSSQLVFLLTRQTKLKADACKKSVPGEGCLRSALPNVLVIPKASCRHCSQDAINARLDAPNAPPLTYIITGWRSVVRDQQRACGQAVATIIGWNPAHSCQLHRQKLQEHTIALRVDAGILLERQQDRAREQ